MRIITLSTHAEACGIATYDDRLRAALSTKGHACDVHPIDRTRLESRGRRELRQHFAPFVERLAQADAVVLQHEFGLYAGAYDVKAANTVFRGLVAATAAARKPCCVVFHTERPAFPRRRTLLGLRRRSKAAREWAATLRIIRDTPGMTAVTHGSAIRRRLVDDGLPDGKIVWVPHPLPVAAAPTRPDPVPGLLAIFGFVSGYKGYMTALRALSILPAHYRLVIAGGPHPRGGDRTLDSIAAVLETGHFPDGGRVKPALLKDRVAVTGWLPAAEATALLERTDLLLAPYGENGPAGSGAVATAIAAGRPLIASRIGAFTDITASYSCMELVAPDAPFELAHTILRLAADPARQAMLVSEARRFAADNGWDGFADRILAALSLG